MTLSGLFTGMRENEICGLGVNDISFDKEAGVHIFHVREGKTKNETKSGLVGEMVEWFPVPPERKAKIESQIKSGLNRVYREIQREEEVAAALASGKTVLHSADDDDDEDDQD